MPESVPRVALAGGQHLDGGFASDAGQVGIDFPMLEVLDRESPGLGRGGTGRPGPVNQVGGKPVKGVLAPTNLAVAQRPPCVLYPSRFEAASRRGSSCVTVVRWAAASGLSPFCAHHKASFQCESTELLMQARRPLYSATAALVVSSTSSFSEIAWGDCQWPWNAARPSSPRPVA